MLAWLFTKSISLDELARICGEVESKRREFKHTKIEDAFYGFSFGKYDFVLDFFCQSGKVASYYVTEVGESLQNYGIQGAFSHLLCKTIEHNTASALSSTVNKPKKPEAVITSYMYMRPSDTVEKLDQSFEELISESPELKDNVFLLWNDSAYPLILTVSGDRAIDVMETSMSLRAELGKHLSETSSFVALQHGADDRASKNLFAITLVKQRKIPLKLSVAFEPERLLSQADGTILDCLGWYDYCVIHSVKTLSELEKRIFSLRQENKGNIAQTSTMLMRSIECERLLA